MKKTFFSIFFTLLFCGFVFAQESKPLRILEKAQPSLPENYGNLDIQGAVRLRVTFLANGKVGEISSVSSLPYGLTENAVEAAKKIKFEPARKEGIFVNVTKIVEYIYGYGGWQRASNQFENNKRDDSKTDEKAEAVLKKAVEKLGGDNYLKVKSIVGRGKFSVLRDGAAVSYQSFTDVLVYPDKERTEFKEGGVKTVQTNVGETGWIFDGAAETIGVQNKAQIENFKRGVRVSIDNLLRGYWRGTGTLTYGGKRPASLGKRSEVLKLTFEDGFTVEFEFSDEYFPIKAIYKRTNSDNEEIKEEDRYAQFVDISGIKTPFIVDHFTNGQQTSRINYETIEINKTIPDAFFIKPNSAKELKKDLKF
jgi:TonB family protein